MTKKILIVDDEADVLSVLTKRLSGAGYQVIQAQDGRKALALAKKEMPSLIVLDIMMPGMSGAQVGADLKNDPATKDIPVIFLTCLLTRDEEGNIGHEHGGNFFVAKPYRAEEFLQIIREHI
jgi:CheY-like chemotaxis protein